MLTDGLTAYWKLEEDNDFRRDAHTDGWNLFQSAPVFQAPGRIEQGANFQNNGNYLYVDASAFDISGSFSVSAWVMFTTVDTDQALIGKWTSNGSLSDGWFLGMRVAGGTHRFRFTSNNQDAVNGEACESPAEIEPFVWYHVVFALDQPNGEMGHIWVNGVRTDDPHITPTASVNPLMMGKLDAGQFADCVIDEVGIWMGRALTDADVLALYNGGAGLQYPFTGSEPVPQPTYGGGHLPFRWPGIPLLRLTEPISGTATLTLRPAQCQGVGAVGTVGQSPRQDFVMEIDIDGELSDDEEAMIALLMLDL